VSIQLTEHMFYIGGLRPSVGYSQAKRIHAVVRRIRAPRRFPYFAQPVSYYSLCGFARWDLDSESYRANADETIGIHDIDCKFCTRLLGKHLGHHDLSSPDWEI